MKAIISAGVICLLWQAMGWAQARDAAYAFQQRESPSQWESFEAGYSAGTAGMLAVGKPFSATAVTRTTQTLANGAHINRVTSELVFQDSEGRFRREVDGQDSKMISITDPVARASYALTVSTKTARSTPLRPLAYTAKAGDVSAVQTARLAAKNMPNTVVEDLGYQTINGVMAQGARTTTMIPIGSIGNDQELKTTTERWYSNDIHALVRSVVSDPRTGTTIYELTGIVRTPPDPALFQVPATYTLTDSFGGWRLLQPTPKK